MVDFAPKDYERGEIQTRLLHYSDDPFKCDWVEAISVDYGQRHKKETTYARMTCKRFGIHHRVLHIGGILSGKGVMLTDTEQEIPDISYDDIKGVSPTYVPFRNGTLLSVITAHAQKWVNQEIEKLLYKPPGPGGYLKQQCDSKEEATLKAKDTAGIYFGAHAEDAANWAYPDCTPEFIGAMANAIYIGSYQAIRLYTPVQWLTKDDIVRLGVRLGVDWPTTWSCYAGGEYHCGTCPTCRARKAAFLRAMEPDPTIYANDPEVRAEAAKRAASLDDEIPF
jgi:7-cyano-7-deazaguanine synthase